MKKRIKRISALVLAVACCFVLCSCSAIKEMRASQAVYTDNFGEIIFNGQTYVKLPISELPEGLEINVADNGHLTEKDVPVLLSAFFGQWINYNHNKTVVYDHSGNYYAREDVNEYVVDVLNHPYIYSYCIETEDDLTLEKSCELLKQRYINAIYEIVSDEANEKPEPIYYSDMETVATDWATIYKCDEKMIFQTSMFEVEEYEGGEIVITSLSDGYGFLTSYTVPEDKKAMMKELLDMDQGDLF